MSTPLSIEIALHYHCCSGDVKNLDAPAVSEQCREFVVLGLLKPNQQEFCDKDARCFEPTEKLAAYVEMLTRIPYPVQCFINPETHQIVGELPKI